MKKMITMFAAFVFATALAVPSFARTQDASQGAAQTTSTASQSSKGAKKAKHAKVAKVKASKKNKSGKQAASTPSAAK